MVSSRLGSQLMGLANSLAHPTTKVVSKGPYNGSDPNNILTADVQGLGISKNARDPQAAAAFEAARWAIDEVKATAPIWKREHGRIVCNVSG